MGAPRNFWRVWILDAPWRSEAPILTHDRRENPSGWRGALPGLSPAPPVSIGKTSRVSRDWLFRLGIPNILNGTRPWLTTFSRAPRECSRCRCTMKKSWVLQREKVIPGRCGTVVWRACAGDRSHASRGESRGADGRCGWGPPSGVAGAGDGERARGGPGGAQRGRLGEA
jgi:hypothetical protein